jgi:hypothetical protein
VNIKSISKNLPLCNSACTGPCFLLLVLGIGPPKKSTTSLLVLWVDAHEIKSPEVVDEEKIVGEEIMLSHGMLGNKNGCRSGSKERSEPGILGSSGRKVA